MINNDYVKWLVKEVSMEMTRYRVDVVLANGNYYGSITETKSLSEAIEYLLSRGRNCSVSEGRLKKLIR